MFLFPEKKQNVLTGPAGVAALGRHISKLLDQGAEKFARFQPVPARPLPPARVRRSVRQAQIQGRGFAQAAVQQLHFPPLVSLQLRDLPQMPVGQLGMWQNDYNVSKFTQNKVKVYNA